jgi:dihydroorotate dehydrogenase
MSGLLYRFVYRVLLQHLPAEATHHVSFAGLRALAWLPGGQRLLRFAFAPSARTISALAVNAMGMQFSSPLGLAAGFDKDGKGVAALQSLGFGFIEIGTVTAEAQPGNPKPRLFRLTKDRAVINRMGFNNDGAEAASARLNARPSGILGINIGKTKRVEEHDALSDYRTSAERLAPYADYMVVNVSSPNTPGLRNLQAVEKLRPLLQEVRATLDRVAPIRRVPLLVKIAPDLSDDDIDAVAALALELELDGIIATNTTISRAGLRTVDRKVTALGAGGLSGAPLKSRSLEVLRRLRALVGDRVCLVSVGGIETGEDAWQRIVAGASLVQGYTGFIYGGPSWAKQVTTDLAAHMKAAGFERLQAAIGSEAISAPVAVDSPR